MAMLGKKHYPNSEADVEQGAHVKYLMVECAMNAALLTDVLVGMPAAERGKQLVNSPL
jgi:hypothetical protein